MAWKSHRCHSKPCYRLPASQTWGSKRNGPRSDHERPKNCPEHKWGSNHLKIPRQMVEIQHSLEGKGSSWDCFFLDFWHGRLSSSIISQATCQSFQKHLTMLIFTSNHAKKRDSKTIRRLFACAIFATQPLGPNPFCPIVLITVGISHQADG